MIPTDDNFEFIVETVRSQVRRALDELDEQVEEIVEELGIKLSDDSDEDRSNNQKLIPVDIVVAELYRMRDKILDDYLPTWGTIATGNIQARLDLWVHAMGAAVAALHAFDLRGLRDVFHEWLLICSPRGLIVATERARAESIQRLVAAALRPRGERRRWKSVSSRNRG